MKNILNLIKLSEDRRQESKDETSKYFFREIIGHLYMLHRNLSVSQKDFHEIVSEELKKELEIEKKVSSLVSELETIKKELDKIGEENKRNIELKRVYQQKAYELEQEKLSLPFGPTGPTGVPTGPSGNISFDPTLPINLDAPLGPTGFSVNDDYY